MGRRSVRQGSFVSAHGRSAIHATIADPSMLSAFGYSRSAAQILARRLCKRPASGANLTSCMKASSSRGVAPPGMALKSTASRGVVAFWRVSRQAGAGTAQHTAALHQLPCTPALPCPCLLTPWAVQLRKGQRALQRQRIPLPVKGAQHRQEAAQHLWCGRRAGAWQCQGASKTHKVYMRHFWG